MLPKFRPAAGGATARPSIRPVRPGSRPSLSRNVEDGTTTRRDERELSMELEPPTQAAPYKGRSVLESYDSYGAADLVFDADTDARFQPRGGHEDFATPRHATLAVADMNVPFDFLPSLALVGPFAPRDSAVDETRCGDDSGAHERPTNEDSGPHRRYEAMAMNGQKSRISPPGRFPESPHGFVVGVQAIRGMQPPPFPPAQPSYPLAAYAPPQLYQASAPPPSLAPAPGSMPSIAYVQSAHMCQPSLMSAVHAPGASIFSSGTKISSQKVGRFAWFVFGSAFGIAFSFLATGFVTKLVTGGDAADRHDETSAATAPGTTAPDVRVVAPAVAAPLLTSLPRSTGIPVEQLPDTGAPRAIGVAPLPRRSAPVRQGHPSVPRTNMVPSNRDDEVPVEPKASSTGSGNDDIFGSALK